MAIVPRIESRTVSIADLFKEFYSVPDFQREYVWDKNNVQKLIEDISLELSDETDIVRETEYFLGSIVVFRDESGTSQLIDGQQRLTTIYLIFCVIRDYLKELGHTSQSIQEFIAGVSQDTETGEDRHKHKLILQYGDGSEILSKIASSEIEIKKIDKKKLGNLALLEKTINSSISDKTYNLKKEGYRNSNILLTRSLVDKPQVGKNTQFDQAIKQLNIISFDGWDSEAIDKRQHILANLAKKVWGMPEDSKMLQEGDILF